MAVSVLLMRVTRLLSADDTATPGRQMLATVCVQW